MKKMTILFAALILAGCAYGTDKVTNMMADPHFAAYEKNMDELEHSYLSGTIKYSEYVEKRKQLEDTYDKEVKHRGDIISQPAE